MKDKKQDQPRPVITSLIGGVLWHLRKGDLKFSIVNNKEWRVSFKKKVAELLANQKPDYCLTTVDKDLGILLTQTCYEIGIPYSIILPRIETKDLVKRAPASYCKQTKFYIKKAICVTKLDEPAPTSLDYRDMLKKKYLNCDPTVLEYANEEKAVRALPWMHRNLYMLQQADYAILAPIRQNDSPLWKFTLEQAQSFTGIGPGCAYTYVMEV